MFRRILHRCKNDTSYTRGMVITGQPGIGAGVPDGSLPMRQLTGANDLQEKLPS